MSEFKLKCHPEDVGSIEDSRILLVTAALPGRVDLNRRWAFFYFYTPVEYTAQELERFKTILGPFYEAGQNKVVFLDPSYEKDSISSTAGVEEICLYSCFVTVTGLSNRQIADLNDRLVRIFGQRTEDPLGVLRRLAESLTS